MNKWTIGVLVLAFSAVALGAAAVYIHVLGGKKSSPVGARGYIPIIGDFSLKKIVGGLVVFGAVAGLGNHYFKPKAPTTLFTAGFSGVKNRGISASVSDGGSREVWLLVFFVLCAVGGIAYWYFYVHTKQNATAAGGWGEDPAM